MAAHSLAPGSRVRLKSLPEWLLKDLPDGDVAALQRLLGTKVYVHSLDSHGYLWLGSEPDQQWFCVELSCIVFS